MHQKVETVVNCDKCGRGMKSTDPLIVHVIQDKRFHLCGLECYKEWLTKLGAGDYADSLPVVH